MKKDCRGDDSTNIQKILSCIIISRIFNCGGSKTKIKKSEILYKRKKGDPDAVSGCPDMVNYKRNKKKKSQNTKQSGENIPLGIADYFLADTVFHGHLPNIVLKYFPQ